MPCTYAKDKAKARFVESLLPWPTIMPVKIGYIGKTQGVKDNSNPPIKNATSVSQTLSLFNMSTN